MNAMDLALEQRVRRAIDTHFEGCTILLITHRLETVLNSAHVVWIDDGRITAEGDRAKCSLTMRAPSRRPGEPAQSLSPHGGSSALLLGPLDRQNGRRKRRSPLEGYWHCVNARG